MAIREIYRINLKSVDELTAHYNWKVHGFDPGFSFYSVSEDLFNLPFEVVGQLCRQLGIDWVREE